MELALLKSKTFQNIIFGALIVVLALASIGMIVYLQRTGRITQLLTGLVGRIALKEETPPAVEEMPSEKLEEEVIPPLQKFMKKRRKRVRGLLIWPGRHWQNI